ncbi:MAG: hypothetical protein WA890_15260, partial [Micromonospora sp.]
DTLAAYPGTEAVRVYRNSSQTLPSWTGTVLGPIVSAGAVPHLSFKIWDLAALTSWLNAMPSTQRLILTYSHEPEQQTSGDPDPATFKSRWLELVQTLEAHPARSRITLAPVYTHYWWEHHTNPDATWWPADAAYGIDAIGFDVYNESSSTYRDPADMLQLCRDMSAKLGKPYLIAEWGAERVTGDTTGNGCADFMRSFVQVLHADDAVSGTWFHYGGDDLIAQNRTVEQQTLASLIAAESAPPPSTGGITYVESGKTLNSAASTTLTVPAPAGLANGNFLVGLMGYIGTSVTVTDPALTFLAQQIDTSNLTSRTYTKTAASEGASYVFTLSSARKAVGWVGAFRGTHATTPLSAYASGTSPDGTAHTAPAVAVPDGGVLLTMVVSRLANTGTATTWTGSGGDTKRWDAASNVASSSDITVAVFQSAPLAAGTYARTLTANQTQTEVTLWSVALAPAPVAPTVSPDLVPGVPIL